VRNSAFLFKREFRKCPSLHLKDRVIPKPPASSGVCNDPPVDGSRKVTDTMFICECNYCREVCVAVFHVLHNSENPLVTYRVKHVRGIRAGKSIQCIDGKAGVIDDEWCEEMIECILRFLPGDLSYIFRAEFGNIERNMANIK
jgi:hypothetical protein